MSKFNINERIVVLMDNICIPGFINNILENNLYHIKNYHGNIIEFIHQDYIHLINPNVIQCGSNVLILENNGVYHYGTVIHCLSFQCFNVRFQNIEIQKNIRLQNIIHIYDCNTNDNYIIDINDY